MLIAIFIALLVLIGVHCVGIWLFLGYVSTLAQYSQTLSTIAEPLAHHAESLARLAEPQGMHGPIG